MSLFRRRRPDTHSGPRAQSDLDRILAAGVRLDPGTDRTPLASLAGPALVRAVAAASPDGHVTDLEILDSVDGYEGALRDLARAAGRAGELTEVACSYVDGEPTCTVSFTFAGTTHTEEPDWYGDRADGMFLATTAERFEPPGRRAVAVIDEDEGLTVLYVDEAHHSWIDELAQPPL